MTSITLQRYLTARFIDGLAIEDAAFEAGMSLAEAKLTDQAVDRGELAVPSAVTDEPDPAPDLPPVLPLRAARARLGIPEEDAAPHARRVLDAITPPPQGGTRFNQEEKTMGRGSNKAEEKVVEIKTPDFEKAVRIFRHDIKPANEKSGEHAQAASTAYKAIKELGVNTRAAKFVFQLAGESEEKRNDVLRSIRGLLGAIQIGITDDLVSKAEGEESGGTVIPTAAAQPPELLTVQ